MCSGIVEDGMQELGRGLWAVSGWTQSHQVSRREALPTGEQSASVRQSFCAAKSCV